MSSFIQKTTYYFLPRSLRKFIIKTMISAERLDDPREATKWLLGVYDYVNYEIDAQCKRWGDGIHIKHEVMDGIHSFFYERIENNSSVLDLGCGNGALAYDIAVNSNAKVLAIDFDANQVEFGRRRFAHSNIHFIIGDVFKDIPEVGSVDVVVLSSVLEHLRKRPEFLKDLTMRFKPKKFLIRVPTFERNIHAALKKELGLFPYTDDTHELEYSKDVFYEEMKLAGLEVKYFEIRWADIWAECIPVK